jgi:hypothetical protein
MQSQEIEKRVLKINPELFSMSNPNNTTRKRQRQPNNPNKIKIKSTEPKRKQDTLKQKSILNMIRKQQQERYKQILEEAENKQRGIPPPKAAAASKPDDDNVSDSIFKEATDFLNHISKKTEQENKKNYTLKNHSILPKPISPSSPTPQIDTTNLIEEWYQTPQPVPLPPSNWGCLKNGNLPTYRNYMNKTRTNQPMIFIGGGEAAAKPSSSLISYAANNQIADKIESNLSRPVNNVNVPNPSGLNERLQRANTAIQIKDSIKQHTSFRNQPYKIMKRKKTKRRTHKVGKSKQIPKIGVLVSNKTIRSHVNTQTQLLKQTPIEEVKRFLIKHGIIKIGTIAPNDVLRKMYETASLMCGEVYNHNRDTLLYNFINGEKE